jgi:hypothetical protein
MSTALKVTEEITTKYEYAESEQSFSENSHFDHRPERDSWGFSFYTHGQWRKISDRITSREEAIAWGYRYIGNEVTSYAGSYKIREVIHSVVITEGEGSYEKVERNSVIEFHVVQRTTFEQQQMNIQHVADMEDLRKNRIAVEVSLGFRKPVAIVETLVQENIAEPVVNSETVSDDVKNKSWFQKIFSKVA